MLALSCFTKTLALMRCCVHNNCCSRSRGYGRCLAITPAVLILLPATTICSSTGKVSWWGGIFPVTMTGRWLSHAGFAHRRRISSTMVTEIGITLVSVPVVLMLRGS
ncbi:hypothetical protein AVEN_171406-1 [Araneus ventricosus]|uniref:Uncharacterized protein n=1 Tax=Araneus ventricosus TaxID=182803 RepID=A0A4Y2D2J6_ARAVE|nr:hypothetical protein AVEN_171406-1 [Araneus ventricosus]